VVLRCTHSAAAAAAASVVIVKYGRGTDGKVSIASYGS
jgi:hypothetical protein